MEESVQERRVYRRGQWRGVRRRKRLREMRRENKGKGKNVHVIGEGRGGAYGRGRCCAFREHKTNL